jgi:hypothetical protein
MPDLAGVNGGLLAQNNGCFYRCYACLLAQVTACRRRCAFAGFCRAFDKLMSRLRMVKGQYFAVTLVLSGHHGAGLFYRAGIFYRAGVAV